MGVDAARVEAVTAVRVGAEVAEGAGVDAAAAAERAVAAEGAAGVGRLLITEWWGL